MKNKQISAQQYPGIAPPSGWVPAIGPNLMPMAVYDNVKKNWVGLPIQALIEALVQAEQLSPLGKIDSRNAVTLTVPSGAAVGAYATRKYIEVPADEVWYLSQVQLVTPAQAGGIVVANFRLSPWKDSAATPDADGLPFWAANQGQAAGGTYTAQCSAVASGLFAVGDVIGAPLRLPPSSKLALVAEVTTAALTADCTATLTPFGWKGKRLVQ